MNNRGWPTLESAAPRIDIVGDLDKRGVSVNPLQTGEVYDAGILRSYKGLVSQKFLVIVIRTWYLLFQFL